MAPKARLYIHHGTADDIVYYPFNAELTVDNLHNEGGLTTLVRYEDHDHYSPAIWTPFMEVGGKVFTFGLLMSSCNYFKQSKLGVILVLIGTSVVYLPWGWDNILGYLFITVGFYINFYRQSLSQNGSKQEI